MPAKPTYVVDYTQDADGRWSAQFRMPRLGSLACTGDDCPCMIAGKATPSRDDMVDCVSDVYALVGDDAALEVGDVSSAR
jgi:hypothetical protein